MGRCGLGTVRRMRINLTLALAVVIVAGCSAQRDDAWVDQVRGREAAKHDVRFIGADDGAFAAQVPAALYGSIEPGAEADYAALDIGSDTPIECALYHDEVEAASSIQTFADKVFADLEARYGASAEREISELDAGVIGASPFLKVYWRYRIARDEGEVVGELKQMIASREGRSIYCVHHENGYAESFERVFRDFVGTMRFSAYDDLRPYFTQVDVLSSRDGNFGYSVVTATLEEDGDPRIVRYTATLARGEAGQLSARDVTEVERSTVNGVLRNKLYTDYRDGEVASALILEGADGAGWRVSGERDGDSLQAVFEQGRLESWLGSSRAFRLITAAVDEGGRVVEARVWDPDLDVDASVARRFELENALDGNRFAASVSVGPRRSQAVVDRDGLMHRETRTTEQGEILRQRVFVEGALR